MINRSDHPVAWAILLYELEDAQEHLENFSKQMSREGRIDVEDFTIQIAHVYAHLNRVWNARNEVSELTDEQWNAFRKFPADIEPVA